MSSHFPKLSPIPAVEGLSLAVSHCLDPCHLALHEVETQLVAFLVEGESLQNHFTVLEQGTINGSALGHLVDTTKRLQREEIKTLTPALQETETKAVGKIAEHKRQVGSVETQVKESESICRTAEERSVRLRGLSSDLQTVQKNIEAVSSEIEGTVERLRALERRQISSG